MFQNGRVSNKHQLQGRELADLTDSVLGDLAWLRDTDLKSADEGALRDLSARLRRLLIDGGGTLQRLRRANGLRGELGLIRFDGQVACVDYAA